MYDSYFKHVRPFDLDCQAGALADGRLDDEAQAYFAEVIELLRKLDPHKCRKSPKPN